MDDKWFKQQQKRVGVTADEIANELGRDRSLVSRIYVGRQRMKLAEAKVFAKVLEKPLPEILERAGVLDPEQDEVAGPGFSEGDVTPWVGRSSEKGRVQTIAETFGGGRSGVDVWRVNSSALALDGYLRNDLILVDTFQSERCKAGDFVIAQVYDWQSGTAATLLRRFEPPVLVSSSTDPEEKRVHVVDGNNVAIKGKIIASWRT